MTRAITADRDEFRATHLRGALAAIIADPDCCAASKAIARGALKGAPFQNLGHDANLSEDLAQVSDREAVLTELVQLGQEAGDYGAPEMREDRQQAEASFKAREAALVEALELAWAEAQKMRKANLLVGPYPNDRKAHSIWVRSLYHAGKDLCEKLRPYRNLARVHTATEGERPDA